MLTQLHQLPTKQFGDACEHVILGELGLAGWPVVKMPSGWPGHDLQVSHPNGEVIRISVKDRRAGAGRRGRSWDLGSSEGWDWLALMRVSVETGKRDVFLVPRAKALEWTVGQQGNRIYTNSAALQRYRDNFALDPDPAPISAAATAPSRAR